MSLNETAASNSTKPSHNVSFDQLSSFTDPDADVFFGFWLNGIGIIVIGIIGIFGNIASIRVLSHKQMRSSVNFILIALASSDLGLIISAIFLFALTTVYPYNGYLKDYLFLMYPTITGITFPLATILQTVSIYLTFLISFERYIAVCHPLKAKSFCTKERTKVSIFVVVLLSIIYNIPRFFEIAIYSGTDQEYGTFYAVIASKLRRDTLYIKIYIHWLYCIFINLIPLSGITFFNLMIYRQVKIVNRMRIKLTRKEMQDIKLTTMLFCVVIVFLSCNFPAVLTNILETFYGIHNDHLTKLSNFFVTVNSSVNFIIYVVLVKKFRAIFIKQIKAFTSCNQKNKKTRFTKQPTISSSDSEQTTLS